MTTVDSREYREFQSLRAAKNVVWIFPRYFSFTFRFLFFVLRVPYAPTARNDGDATEVVGCCHANQMATKLLPSRIPVWNMRKEHGVHSRTDTAPADPLDRIEAQANHACRAQFDSAHRP